MRFVAAIALSLAVIASHDAPARGAAVAVIANRTAGEVEFTLRAGDKTREIKLRAGASLPLRFSNRAEISFSSAGVARQYALDGASLYYFSQFPGGVDLDKAGFREAGKKELPPELSAGEKRRAKSKDDDPKPTRSIPIKLLADDNQPNAREFWEEKLRQRVAAASKIIERQCGVKFEVVEVDTWKSDEALRNPSDLLKEFKRVKVEPAWLALGFCAQHKLPRGAVVRHGYPEPFASHLLVFDWDGREQEAEQIEFLVNALGRYLGASESGDPASVMRPLSGDAKALARDFPIEFDAPNTLALNLIAGELNDSGARHWRELTLDTRQHLRGIYCTLGDALQARVHDRRRGREVASGKPPRGFSARMVDGTQITGGVLREWGEAREAPRLDTFWVFDPERPFRWIRNHELTRSETPKAFVEFVGGDRLPGRVVGYEAGGESFDTPAHLLVEAEIPLNWRGKGATQERPIRVRADAIQRIVWQRSPTDKLKPGVLLLRSGGQITYRSLHFSADGVRLLRDGELQQVPYTDIAELRPVAANPWPAYFEQLAVLDPAAGKPLIQLETSWGLNVTTSLSRFLAQSQGSRDEPRNWRHVVQPAWSLDPLWVEHDQVFMRRFFLPTEFPLSRVVPNDTRRKSFFGGAWDWRANRNTQGGSLASGGEEAQWGFGVQAYSELRFDLPACARAFRTQIGLDRVVGSGGCARAMVYADSLKGKPLYRSSLLVGSREVFDTGPLEPRQKSPAAWKLILLAHPAHKERPPGADPLDIRDMVDWLEPRLELDPNMLQSETNAASARLLAAWTGWTPLADSPARLVNYWDHADAKDPRFRIETAPIGEETGFTRKVKVSSKSTRLVVGVSRIDKVSTPSRIDIRVDGETIDHFKAPVEKGAHPPAEFSLSLGDYDGRQIKVEIVQVAEGKRSMVHWRRLAIVD